MKCAGNLFVYRQKADLVCARDWLQQKCSIKSSLYWQYYAEACNPLRAHLRSVALELRSSEETSLWWLAVNDTDRVLMYDIRGL